MSPQPARKTVKLSQLAPGTKFRLFTKYRDKSPRPRFKLGKQVLAQHELEVFEVAGDVVWVSFADQQAPLWGDLRVVL